MKIGNKTIVKTDDSYKKELLKNNPNYVKTESNVISFFISDDKSKVLLARQFGYITKKALFENISYFHRNLDNAENKNKTNFVYLERNNRYIYMRISESNINTNKESTKSEGQTLLFVLITKSSFSIFESNEILKMIYRLMIDICSEGLNSIQIKQKAYDIVLGVDDIVNFSQGRDETNLSNLKSSQKMESNDAKVFDQLQKEKEGKAREKMIKEMETIDRLKRENRYIDNSISSEYIKQKEELQEQINQEAMVTESIINSLVNHSKKQGMNLHERFSQRLMQQKEEELRVSSYLFACQNIIQNMIITEMKKHLEGDSDDEYEESNTIIITSLGKFEEDD